jgi:hypothetical protein
MRQSSQQFVAPVLVHDGFCHDRSQPRHAISQPSRHVATVQRQVGATGPSGHFKIFQRMIPKALPFASREPRPARRLSERFREAMDCPPSQRWIGLSNTVSGSRMAVALHPGEI